MLSRPFGSSGRPRSFTNNEGRICTSIKRGLEIRKFNMLKNIRKLARKDLTSLNKVIGERAAMETAFS
jgi:hypothetical protein